MTNVAVQPANAGTAPIAVQASAFRANTQRTIKRPGVVLTAALSAAVAPLPDTQIPPTTLLRCIYIEVTATPNAGTTGVFNADAPLNVFANVNFHDAQGTSIVGNFDSFTLAMAQKWFGFTNNSDPVTSAVYANTPASGAFTVVFRIPVEVVARTGVGAQINTDTQSPLVLSLTLNSAGSTAGVGLFSTAPTVLPTVSVVISYGGYWNQSGNPNSFATPTAVGTLNYVNWTNYTGLSGQQQFQLSNIGLGNSVANVMFVNRLSAAGNARSDSAFANPLQVAYRGNVLGSWSELLWKHIMSEAYDFTNFTQDAGLGAVAASSTPALNQGVYNLWFNDDFTFDPGNTLFYSLLNSAVGDSIELTGNWPTASVMYEIINFLAVSGPVSAIQGH
jgi:hypothetical protein